MGSLVTEAQSSLSVQIPAALISPGWGLPTSEVHGQWQLSQEKSVHVPIDLLQQWVQCRIRLGLLDDLNQLRVLGDKLPEVHHFLEKFWEEKGIVRMVALQVELEHVHDPLLHLLNVPYV